LVTINDLPGKSRKFARTRRKFPASDSLDDARDELGRLRTLNKGRFDWDAEKRKAEEERRRAVTLAQWGERPILIAGSAQ